MTTPRKKGIIISLAGTDVPIFLLDDTQLVIKVTTTTTAGAACIALRAQLKLERDAHFCLFEQIDEQFRIIEDATQLAKLLVKWPQDSPFSGPRRLYFKRSLRIPDSCTDTDERAAPAMESAPHRLAYIDTIYQFLHGTYRFDVTVVVRIAALHLYASRGPWTAQDTLLRFKPLVEHLLPCYACKDLPLSHPRSHGVGKVEDALGLPDAAKKVLDEYKGMGSYMSQFQAQQSILALCRDHPCYGYEFFNGRRTWKEKETFSDNSSKEVARSEEIVVCIGYEGLFYLLMDDPLAIVTHDYQDMNQWNTSRDGKIFALSIEDGTLLYIVTDMAPYLELTVERYVEAKVQAIKAAEEGGDPDKSRNPRPDKEFGTLPFFARIVAPRCAPYAVPVWPLPSGCTIADELDMSILPQGWLALQDRDGDTYYFEESSGSSSWVHPLMPAPPLPVGWEEATDPDTGDVYYWHEETNEATWERPPPDPLDVEAADAFLLPGWAVARDAEGDAYFFNTASGQTTWTKPRDPNAPPLTAAFQLTPRPAAAGALKQT